MRNADAERLLTVRALYDELPCRREIIDDVGVPELPLVGPPDEYALVIVAIVSPWLIIHHVIKTFPDALVQGIEILFGGRRTQQRLIPEYEIVHIWLQTSVEVAV